MTTNFNINVLIGRTYFAERCRGPRGLTRHIIRSGIVDNIMLRYIDITM